MKPEPPIAAADEYASAAAGDRHDLEPRALDQAARAREDDDRRAEHAGDDARQHAVADLLHEHT